MFENYDSFKIFVSERIVKLREYKNISAQNLSLSLGLGKNYINTIENKKSMPSMEKFYIICEFFEIEPKEFFDDQLKVPALNSELFKEINKMDENSLKNLLGFIQSMRA